MEKEIKVAEGLPIFCYAVNNVTNEVIIIEQGESGYYTYHNGAHKGKETAMEFNERLGVTRPQMEAMFAGSLFGWHVPAADPANYNEDGSFKV